MEEQLHGQSLPQTGKRQLTFRNVMDIALVFGCVPALVLNIIFWAITTAFSQAGALPIITSLLITLILGFIGIVLIVRYVDICVVNFRKSNDAVVGGKSEEYALTAVGAGIICGFLTLAVVAILSTAGVLEGWHYTLMAVEVLLTGYQTWRVFLGHRA